jgi:hypothetical protein
MTLREGMVMTEFNIDAAKLMEALQEHALGESKMTATQVSAAIALLKKVLPDLPGSVAAALAENTQALRSHEEALRELE